MRRSALKTLLLLAASLGVAVLAGEGILRIMDYSSPSFYTIDEDLGLTLRPGAEGWWTKEGKAYVRINSDGLRDVEHVVQKPPGTVRVAVLGDSYAEGLQLPIEKLFWKVLEKELNECAASADRVEIINFGISGYGTGRQLLMLRKKVWDYQPDIVVLAFLTGNDIRDNSKTLNGIDYIPYFQWENGQLVLDESYLQSAAFARRRGWLARIVYRYIDDVRLLQLANDARAKWRTRQQVRQQQGNAQEGAELGLDDAIYVPPETAAWQEAWGVTEALVRQVAEEVRAGGAQFLLVTLSNGAQVHPDPKARRALAEQVGAEDLFYPDRRIVSLARANGIDAMMLGPELRQWAEVHGTCVHGFANSDRCGGHWNEYGHRLAGELMAEKMCREFFG